MRGSLLTFGTALLADAVGLGKTYIALAVATLYDSIVAVPPASLRSQWKRVSASLGIDLQIVSHEALSRGGRIGATDLVVVDEAHRIRNPDTRLYNGLARSIRRAHLLLITATPVVNSSADLVSILRLGLGDNAFAALGVPSLERASAAGRHNTLSNAAASAIVARSAGSLKTLSVRLPRITNAPIIRLPTAVPSKLDRLLHLLDQLEFPCVGNSRASALLRLHLLYRLASSTAACAETTRRHLSYIKRAISAARRGEALTRRVARQIFASEYELQFDLDDLSPLRARSDITGLLAEQRRLEELLTAFPHANTVSPKAIALREVLAGRACQKTIVFTVAVATALHLARLLRWHRVAVTGAGRAWIASGSISLDEVLSAFAPIARGAPLPPETTQVSTLLATDLASEGLDLQDASAVVHYDLPWTPVKLEQRVGRISRLGSIHTTAEVWWFAPAKPVEKRLDLEARIARKVRCQLRSSVPCTSRVGKTGVINEMLEHRERLGRSNIPRTARVPVHAVVRAPLIGLFAVDWYCDHGVLPELILLGGDPPEMVQDYANMETAISILVSADSSAARPPRELIQSFLNLARSRLAGMGQGSLNQSARRLARRLVKRAYWAGWRRETHLVDLLDTILSRLNVGVGVGAERSLQQLLDLRAPVQSLSDWLEEQPSYRKRSPGFRLIAAILGDGAGTTNCDQSSFPLDRTFSS